MTTSVETPSDVDDEPSTDHSPHPEEGDELPPPEWIEEVELVYQRLHHHDTPSDDVEDYNHGSNGLIVSTTRDEDEEDEDTETEYQFTSFQYVIREEDEPATGIQSDVLVDLEMVR